MDHKENNRQSPDYQNQGDPSNLAKIGIRSLVVEKKARQIIFRWKVKQGKTACVLKIYFPKISETPHKIFPIKNDAERTFIPNENIPPDLLCTMNIELQKKIGAPKEIFFKKTINFNESDRFCFPPEEEKPAKSSTADMPQDDTFEKIQAIDQLLNGEEGLQQERANNLCKDVNPVLDVLQNLKEDSYLKKDFAEKLKKQIAEIKSSIKSLEKQLEKQHHTFGEDIRQIKDDYKGPSSRIEAVDDVLQSVLPIVAFKARFLKKKILDHYNMARDRQFLEIKELAPIIEGINQIINQESNNLLLEDRTAEEVKDTKNFFKPLWRDFNPIYKRIYSDPDTFLKEDISAIEASSMYSHLESLEIFSDESLSDDLELPDPDVFYRGAADKYLNEVKDRCLEKIDRFSSQAYSSLDELRPDLEEFVAHSVFHFLDSTFHKIFEWHETLQSEGRGFDRHHLEQVRSRMLELCGIQTIEPEVYKSKLDPDVHKEIDQGKETLYSDHVILKIVEPGYKIKWTGKVLKKCGVKVNYNTTV